jgi:hypothetical protein
MSFSEILEAADVLSVDEQLEISEILYKRAVDTRRDNIKTEIENARLEHYSGAIHPQTVEEIMREITE